MPILEKWILFSPARFLVLSGSMQGRRQVEERRMPFSSIGMHPNNLIWILRFKRNLGKSLSDQVPICRAPLVSMVAFGGSLLLVDLIGSLLIPLVSLRRILDLPVFPLPLQLLPLPVQPPPLLLPPLLLVFLRERGKARERR